MINKHHTAQRLLKPVAVVNNFDQYLSYPSGNLVTRRDHDKYLGLMESVAYLHQYQRTVKTVNVDGQAVEYIEVTLEDIDAARDCFKFAERYYRAVDSPAGRWAFKSARRKPPCCEGKK